LQHLKLVEISLMPIGMAIVDKQMRFRQDWT
jgi:uncharacterized membrane protein YccF (DUF307 family)